MEKKKGVIGWAMEYKSIVFLLVTVLIVFGVFALREMPKQEFPVFTIRQGLIIGIYPGATPSEVEEQLAKPLEEFIFTFKEVRKAKTYSENKDGMMVLYVELNSNVNNKDEVWSKIKHGIDDFKAQLPAGGLGLIVNDDFGDTSALLITLESESKTYRQLQDYLEKLEGRLRRIESVSNLRRYGLQNEQISIYVEKEKLASYGIDLLGLYQTLSSKGLTVPSGSVDNQELVVPIHITRPLQTEKDIEEQIIYSDSRGTHIRLKDVAKVVREYDKPNNYITNNGKKCIVLSTEMREGYNIVQYGKDVEAALEEFQQSLPDDISVYRIANQPQVVDKSVNTFLLELLIAILSVILVTIILLPLRVAGVAASTIPITIFISLGIMYATGMEINTVTLAALLVVLGMIVDNSIVIVDSYLEKIDQGMPRWDASIDSAKEYFKAIFSATLAISITFFPFLFVLTGQFRDFVTQFPWTILITLGVSLAVATLLIPFMQYFFIRKGLKQPEEQSGKKGKSILDRLQSFYDRTLEKAFKRPYITLGVTGLSVVLGIWLFSTLPVRLFPIAERNQFAVEVYLPKGSSMEETAAVCNDLEAILRKDNRVVSVTSFMGTGSPRFHTSYAPKMGGKNFGQFIVNTTSEKNTEAMLDEYTNAYAYHYTNAFVKFKQMDFLSVNADIEIRVSNDDLEYLKETSESLIGELRKLDEPIRIWSDFEEPLPGINITLDPVEANRLGITEPIVGLTMASRFGGLPITTLWEGDYKVPLKLKSQWDTGDPDAGDIAGEYVTGLVSPAVPITQIAQIKPDWNEGQIVRRNGVRATTVRIDVKRGENTSATQKKVEEVVDRFFEQHSPLPGTLVEYGGAKENDEEQVPSIMLGLAIAILMIFFILVFHFKKVSLAALVFGSASLCLFGAAFGLHVMGLDLSITVVLGLVSLIGIIVRNGIIMFDYTEELRFKHGLSVKEAAFDAGKRRMRPIFLTSAAASMGVIPMILSGSSLWSPMGATICFGTLIAMCFILFALPLIYWYYYRKQDTQSEYDNNKQQEL